MAYTIRQSRIVASALVAYAVLTGCSSGPTVVTNSAPDFSVANFQTFGFLQPLSTDQGNVRTMISTYLIEATTRELEMSGLRRVDDNPDLLVNFDVSTRAAIQLRPSSSVSMHHSRGRVTDQVRRDLQPALDRAITEIFAEFT